MLFRNVCILVCVYVSVFVCVHLGTYVFARVFVCVCVLVCVSWVSTRGFSSGEVEVQPLMKIRRYT